MKITTQLSIVIGFCVFVASCVNYPSEPVPINNWKSLKCVPPPATAPALPAPVVAALMNHPTTEVNKPPMITVVAVSEPATVTYTKDEAHPGSYKSVWVTVKATAYCPCRKCCGKWSRHKRTTYGRSAYLPGVAIDPLAIPPGSFLDIPDYPYGPNGNGSWIEADDTGSKVVGWHIDVRFPTHSEALQWARIHQTVKIRIWMRVK